MAEHRDRHPQFSFGADPDASPARPRRRRRRGLLVCAGAAVLLAGGGAYLHFLAPQHERRLLEGTLLAPSPALTHAYKWRAADGSWHISDQPPAGGVAYEKVTVRSDTNVVPALREPGNE